MKLRFAQAADADAISALVIDLLPFLTISGDASGADNFLATIRPEAIARNLADANFRYQLAERDGALVGVVALRGNSHLYNLYVARQCHGQGLGRLLWEAGRDDALARGNPGSFTLNSSIYGLPMYERLGFQSEGPVMEKDGLRYQPMRLSLGSSQ
ncbi:GNAT family N-acetyltransferase [Pseudoduganella violacea]|uniref:Ribosomal protein S18 acetylase RimI-like enzyme n=1 Tax=Pseudoduganella violacea TaxID=1715466 RepID=A0A7W5B6Y3_9BURK|nr:GNAT family N-acetyltransferase [Pseudoduganella violacea]MBB3117654.1 ribosomal protein S18 acetylase RimI-like enzyme [Pseudoduganella violacea]